MSKETRDAAEGRPSYKDTLNLLQTGFGMRANAVKRWITPCFMALPDLVKPRWRKSWRVNWA